MTDTSNHYQAWSVNHLQLCYTLLDFLSLYNVLVFMLTTTGWSKKRTTIVNSAMAWLSNFSGISLRQQTARVHHSVTLYTPSPIRPDLATYDGSACHSCLKIKTFKKEKAFWICLSICCSRADYSPQFSHGPCAVSCAPDQSAVCLIRNCFRCPTGYVHKPALICRAACTRG